MKKSFIIFYILFSMPVSFSQLDPTQKDFIQKLRKQMEEDSKKAEKLLNKNFLKKFNDAFKDMNNDFFKTFDQLTNDKDFQDVLKGFQLPDNQINHKWTINKGHRVLTLKMSVKNDAPLEINIEKGKLNIKGTVEKQIESTGPKGKNINTRIYTFNQTFSIPKDVDSSGVEYKNLEDGLQISFPFLKKTIKSI